MKRFPDLPPIWAAGFAVVAYLLSLYVPIFNFPRASFLVWVLILGGISLAVWSAVYFLRKKTAIEPFHTPSSLIVEGPYRLTRNPIYLGMFAVLIGIGLWTGGASGLVLVLAFPFVITTRFIRWEEEALVAQFGAEAEAYLSSTSRWVFGL